MAIYLLQMSVPQPIGSVGGLTFQRCGRNLAIRKRNTPVQKRSAKQSVSKNRFEHVQTSYRFISGPGKTSFNSEAPNYPRNNSFGVPYNISGLNLFTSSNINLGNAGTAEITTMPAVVSPPSFTVVNFVLSQGLSSGGVITSPGNVPTDCTLFVYCTAPVGNGISTPRGSYALLYTVPAGSPSVGVNAYPFFQARFGVFANPSQLWVFSKVLLKSNITGQILIEFTERDNIA